MPILHIQYAGKGKTPDGAEVDIPGRTALIQRGPVLQATISLFQGMAEQLAQQGVQLPAPVTGAALIDTGAGMTCIDSAIAESMGLPVVDVAMMTSASHANTQQNVYPITIEFTGFPIRIDAPRAMGAVLAPQGLALLIGRDVLQHTLLVYNGITGQITLSA